MISSSRGGNFAQLTDITTSFAIWNLFVFYIRTVIYKCTYQQYRTEKITKAIMKDSERRGYNVSKLICIPNKFPYSLTDFDFNGICICIMCLFTSFVGELLFLFSLMRINKRRIFCRRHTSAYLGLDEIATIWHATFPNEFSYKKMYFQSNFIVFALKFEGKYNEIWFKINITLPLV